MIAPMSIDTEIASPHPPHRLPKNGLMLVLGLVTLAAMGLGPDSGVGSVHAHMRAQPRPIPPTSEPNPRTIANAGPTALFAQFHLPIEQQVRFWNDPGTQRLITMTLPEVLALVPTQAGLFHCRCPDCGAEAIEDPLGWSLTDPDHLTCRVCGSTIPNASVPIKTAEQRVEVRPGLFQTYPYYAVPADQQQTPDERLYFEAKRHDAIRRFLVRAALMAAIRQGRVDEPTEVTFDGPDAPAVGSWAELAAAILIRFAQVYPQYALRADPPNGPKSFWPADLRPPYQRDGLTAAWDRDGYREIPLECVIAYDLIRFGDALESIANQMDVSEPRMLIERDWFRTAAHRAQAQPEPYSEQALPLYRGLLALGRVMGDQTLIQDALGRLTELRRRGFYYDGLWKHGPSHVPRYVLDQLESWINPLVQVRPTWPWGTHPDPAVDPQAIDDPTALRSQRRLEQISVNREIPEALGRQAQGSRWLDLDPIRDLAAEANALLLRDHAPVQTTTAWPSGRPPRPRRRVGLLGASGVARLGVGSGPNALDAELRGLSNLTAPQYNRLALRLAVEGRILLGDEDDRPRRPDGWDLATASHNTVVVDQTNQRESLPLARRATPGSDVDFFVAEPDLQVVQMHDRHAYPQRTQRYRRTVILAASGPDVRFVVDVFDVIGGQIQDYLLQSPTGLRHSWHVAHRLQEGPTRLLPASIRGLDQHRAEDGRWFVQSYRRFHAIRSGVLLQPTQALLLPDPPDDPSQNASASHRDHLGLRLHIMAPTPIEVLLARTPARNPIESFEVPPIPTPEPNPSPEQTVADAESSSSDSATTDSTETEPESPEVAPNDDAPSPETRSEPGTDVAPENRVQTSKPGSALILRRRDGRRSDDPDESTSPPFVSVLEPLGSAFTPLVGVGRIATEPQAIALRIDSSQGREYFVLNREPGRPLSARLEGDLEIRTDGLVVRLSSDRLTLIGGSFAEQTGRQSRTVRITPFTGRIARSAVQLAPDLRYRGWFETETPIRLASEVRDRLIGRTMLIRHGDGTTHGWTVAGFAQTERGRTRIYVHEYPGWTRDAATGEARYDHFPHGRHPGPHAFTIAQSASVGTANGTAPRRTTD